MEPILSQQELSNQLNEFRDIIQHFDYSEIKNVTFINLESLYTYIAQVEDNPFEKQYQALHKILDIIEPYLPFAMGNTAVEFLVQASMVSSHEEMESLKKRFSSKTRLEFMNAVRGITQDDEWQYLVNICENIRGNHETVIH